MTNIKTAFGATSMMALSALMLLAALEPVTTAKPQAAEISARSAASAAA